MWRDGRVLVPFLNDAPYADKPPLLFWLIEAIWLVTGVSETAARLIPPAAGIGAAALTGWVAHLLWPNRRGLPAAAMLMVVASPIVLLFATLVRFDILLTCWVLLALAGVLKVWRTGDRRWWLMCGLGIGLGLLTKGPVALVLTLPAALFAPLWVAQKPDGGWGRWYGGTGVAVAVAAAIGLAWVLPAAFTGGEEYRDLILWHQTAGRIANAFDHKRPFY
ncbi:MAG: phospholipid carrier-dependent glycosyltransferase, partial [Hyphomicrobiales bacterium]